MPKRGQSEFAWFARFYGNGRNGKLEDLFWEFHYNNPHIYRLLVKYARQWKRHHNKCSIKLLFERVRWDVTVHTNGDANFKLCNNHHAFYARLIEKQEPDLHGFFRFRRQKIQCSFGPDNETLPSGEHMVSG